MANDIRVALALVTVLLLVPAAGAMAAGEETARPELWRSHSGRDPHWPRWASPGFDHIHDRPASPAWAEVTRRLRRPP